MGGDRKNGIRGGRMMNNLKGENREDEEQSNDHGEHL